MMGPIKYFKYTEWLNNYWFTDPWKKSVRAMSFFTKMRVGGRQIC
jgi:hypothetical protein